MKQAMKRVKNVLATERTNMPVETPEKHDQSRKQSLAVVFIIVGALLIPADVLALPDQNVKLHKFSLGSITGEGWLKEDVGRLTKGMGGWGQGLVDPFWEKTATDWDSEFACKTLLGQVLLGWVSGDPAIQNLATSNINRIVSSPFKGTDGYIGFARPDVRKQDYLGWPANQEIRALLLFYEANPSRTDVRDAARDYALWFATNWNRSVYGDKANGLRFEPARPGHGYVGLCVVDAVMEVFKYYPQDKALLDWAKDYQDWYNTSSSYDHTKVDGMRSATYWPKVHAGAIGLTIKVPGLLSCYDPSLGSYREATLNALQRIMDLSATPAGGIDDKGEQLTRFDSPFGDMEYCNFQCYQEDLLVAGAISGQAKWFDYVEKMIYNAAKGATKKDWGAIGYMSRVNQYVSESPFQEYKWKHDPPCCSCSAVISLPLFVDHMMMRDSVGNIYLTTYGPCQLRTDGTPLLSETTEYPFDNDITVKFAKAFDKGIGIKIPTWCVDGRISVRINGATQDIKSVPGTFEIVQKAGGFVAGDTISIVFDGMKGIEVRRHAQMPNHVWIERGPLVFACDVPTRWSQYPLAAHHGYKLAPKDGLAEVEKGYRIDCSDLVLKSAAQVLRCEPSGYLWENPSVRIRIGVKSSMDGGAEKAIDLVPYGCTVLRKTCFETTAGILDDKKAK